MRGFPAIESVTFQCHHEHDVTLHIKGSACICLRHFGHLAPSLRTGYLVVDWKVGLSQD